VYLVLNIIYLNIIPLFGIINLISSLYLTFVKKKRRTEVIVLYTILLSEDGQSHRSKHLVEI
jgi:hypothetical protein